MKDHIFLLRAIRQQIKKDLTLERQEIVALRLRQSTLIGLIYRLLSIPHLRSIGMLTFVFRAFLLWGGRSAGRDGVLVLAGSANEKRALKEIIGDRKIDNRNISVMVKDAALILSRAFSFRKTLKTLNRIGGRKPAYLQMRVVELLVVYFLQNSTAGGVKTILVGSEGNPHGLALLALGKKHKIKTIFASHAPISVNPIAIECDHAILSGEEYKKDLLLAGAKVGSFEFYSRPPLIFERQENYSLKLREVTLCLGMGFNSKAVTQALDYFSHQSMKVKIRAHPNLSATAQMFNSRVEVSAGKSFADDFGVDTFALAGNSTVHLDLWVRGIPSFYWHALDPRLDRLLRFLEKKEVPQIAELDSLEQWRGLNWEQLYSLPIRDMLDRYYSGEKKKNEFKCLAGL